MTKSISWPEEELPEKKEEIPGVGIGEGKHISRRKWVPVADPALPLGSGREGVGADGKLQTFRFKESVGGKIVVMLAISTGAVFRL